MFGLPNEVHAMKLRPWITRLQAGTAALNQALENEAPVQVASGLEDVSFWLGRSIAEVFGAGELAIQDPTLYADGVRTLAAAQSAVLRGNAFLRSLFPAAKHQEG